MPMPNNDTDVYIVIEDFGANGRSYLETDLTQNQPLRSDLRISTNADRESD
jgi:hypothetical protein